MTNGVLRHEPGACSSPTHRHPEGSLNEAPQLKRMSYGHACCIMVLAAEMLRMNPSLLDEARAHLSGRSLHPIAAAALEREAFRMNELLRHDPGLVSQANAYADSLAGQYGFASPSAVDIDD